MRVLRALDWERATSRREGGYTGLVLFNGESCHIIATLVPPGVEGPPTRGLATFVDTIDDFVAPADLTGAVLDPQEPAGNLFSLSWIANRRCASEHAGFYLGEVGPGASGPPMHVHDFDQFYFVLEGRLHVDVALESHDVDPHTLVVLPSGVPHTQRNEGDVPERHLAILVPEPPQPSSAELRWDTVADFREAARQLH